MSKEIYIDSHKLINEVFKRPALWNQKHLSYHNREVTNRVWLEIAAIFKIPKTVVKSKWKGLRDTYRAELKKEIAYSTSKFTRSRPIWVHFKSLHFLKDQMIPNPPIWERNETFNNNQNPEENNPSVMDDDLNQSFTEYPSSMVSVTFETSAVKKEPLENDSADNLKETPEDNSTEQILPDVNCAVGNYMDSESSLGFPIDSNEIEHKDDSYYFLMSLLPHLRSLSSENRLLLQMRMHELILKEVYNKSLAQNNSSPKS